MAKKTVQTSEDVFDSIKKKLKTRDQQDYYYKALERARKLGLHEEFAEHMLECLKAGFDPKHCVDLTAEYLCV